MCIFTLKLHFKTVQTLKQELEIKFKQKENYI